MTRPLRAQRWHEPQPDEEVQRPATPSLEREPWRALQSSSVTRFIGKRGGELDAAQVDPRIRAELVAALEARHRLGSVYATLKSRGFATVSTDQRATLDLFVFGILDVREDKSGAFDLTLRSSGRKRRFTVQEFYGTAFKLRSLV